SVCPICPTGFLSQDCPSVRWYREIDENKSLTTFRQPILPDFETNCDTMWQVIVSIGFSNPIPDGSRGTARPRGMFRIQISKTKTEQRQCRGKDHLMALYHRLS